MTALRHLVSLAVNALLAVRLFSATADGSAATNQCFIRRATWAETVAASRDALNAAVLPPEQRQEAETILWSLLSDEFPIESDWLLQDSRGDWRAWLRRPAGEGDRQLLQAVQGEVGQREGTIAKPLTEYAARCAARRAERLKILLRTAPRIVFTKHATLRPSFFAYTEGQSDAQDERHFLPGAELCLLEMQGGHGRVSTLLRDPTGAIRDPAVSWDARKILFAWKKSLDDDDYHLYEMEVSTGNLRQLTSGLGFADYEPAYLPNGDLIFASTRCVQTVDCWWTEVSNLYTCDGEGRFLRRLTVDQVHSISPAVLEDGRVVYTRWDYNDRGQIFPQALFQMNPDGTAQTEFYGNNSWFPTTLVHARGLPGTQKLLAILCGHHSAQAGKLGVIDPAKGRQENAGAQLVAPVRRTVAERIDAYGQRGELFQYPYPLTETEFLVSYAPLGWERSGRWQGDARFAIYWMDLEGRRELLVADPAVPCQQPMPLMPRPRPAGRPSQVDYRQTTGTFYVRDVYQGPGLADVPRGAIKKLRVIALDFRAAGVGNNGSGGPGGAALISTPIAIGNGSWDVKVVLGDACVHQDGSAFFTVPARTPVYFQALDEKNRAVQTMRSWSTLQPGENASCVGCHEHKNSTPLAAHPASQALRAGPQNLENFHGPPRGFSFRKEVQPILDRHCVRCHSDRQTRLLPPGQNKGTRGSNGVARAFSLLADEVLDSKAKRRWSDAYLNLTAAQPDRDEEARGSYRGVVDNAWVTWIGSQSVPEMLPPHFAGSTRSRLMTLLEADHEGVQLSAADLDKVACWIDLLVPFCGDYFEANAWTVDDRAKYERYLGKRQRMEALEAANIRAFIDAQGGRSGGRQPLTEQVD